jgi:hypothetical protein
MAMQRDASISPAIGATPSKPERHTLPPRRKPAIFSFATVMDVARRGNPRAGFLLRVKGGDDNAHVSHRARL